MNFKLDKLRKWQITVSKLINKDIINYGIIHWMFDDQTFYGGRGKGTFFKHLMTTRSDVKYLPIISTDFDIKKTRNNWIEGLKTDNHQIFVVRLPRADRHSKYLYNIINAIPENKIIIVACSFWPDVQFLKDRNFCLWEWDSNNELHKLPDYINIDGKIGLGNTNSKGDYVPYYNRIIYPENYTK